MFETHARAIRAAAQTSPDVTARVIHFAILTANARMHTAVTATQRLREVDYMGAGGYLDLPLRERSIMAAAMSGAKLLAVQEVTRNIESIHAAYKSMDAETFWHYALDNIRGLGPAKAAFTVQMLYNEMGCLDAHNLREIGVDLKEVSGKSIPRRRRYLELQATRTSQVWWDGWCNFVAKRYPAKYQDGEAVSASHVDAVL